MALPTFTPTGATLVMAQPASQTYPLPGSGGDSTILLTLLDPGLVLVLLGDSSVTVTPSTGIAVMPDAPLVLARGSAGYIAVMVVGGQPRANINLASGT